MYVLITVHGAGSTVEKPDKLSANFLSFIGNLDKRVELDCSIKRGDGKYHAALSMMASKASYENRSYLEATIRDQWKVVYTDH